MLFSRFWNDAGGNIAPIFAAAIIPVIGLTGAAIDYSRASSARAEMQAALDATALMLSKEATSLDSTQLGKKANDYFNALFGRSEVKGVTVDPKFTTINGTMTVNVSAHARLDTMFMRVFNVFGGDLSKMDIGGNSQVTWGMKRIELALALDNTGSMAWWSKMTELKKASHTLIDTLKAASKKDGDVKIAIVPFDTTVNIGTGYKNQNWFDWKDYDIKKKKWEGCVVDRDQPYDVQDTAPEPNVNATLFPAADCGDLTTMLPLTSEWSTLHTKIDDMAPNGNTNVTIGLAWAWHALTAGAPLAEGSAPANDLDKVIILLTDGTNTENRWDSGWGAEKKIDARTQAACDNIKAANIKLYTVRVIEGNASLLQGCASKPDMYYDVQNASQLNAVFSKISQNLATLRIAK